MSKYNAPAKVHHIDMLCNHSGGWAHSYVKSEVKEEITCKLCLAHLEQKETGEWALHRGVDNIGRPRTKK